MRDDAVNGNRKVAGQLTLLLDDVIEASPMTNK